jgi:hypothetical protein
MLADTEAAAEKDYMAFRIDGFVGDEHLRTAIGALHMEDP